MNLAVDVGELEELYVDVEVYILKVREKNRKF